MRTIAVFTGSRAEYGLLKRPIFMLINNAHCRLQTIVSGTHLSPSFGMTIDEIKADRIPVTEQIYIYSEHGGSSSSICDNIGRAIQFYGEALQRLKPDILILLGDRYEAFSMATAATVCRIPIAHLHGGEATFGAMDEPFRHSITKMSHLHFTSCETYRQRVIQLGEHPDRVWNIGALGVESIHAMSLPSEEDVRSFLGFTDKKPYILCTFHPATLEHDSARDQLQVMLRALEKFPAYNVVFTGANADPGGAGINEILMRYAVENASRFHFYMSLGQRWYFGVAKFAACVVGNSSSGVIEVPSLRVPVLDIGDRQKGRVRSSGVLHVDAQFEKITGALEKALGQEHKQQVESALNPYDKSDTAATVIDIVMSFPLDSILKKSFYGISQSL